MAVLPMRSLPKNGSAVIRDVRATGELGRRIRDMGLTPGTPIRIVGRAPLSDPVAVRVKDFTLTLRNNEADFIDVEEVKEQ